MSTFTKSNFCQSISCILHDAITYATIIATYLLIVDFTITIKISFVGNILIGFHNVFKPFIRIILIENVLRDVDIVFSVVSIKHSKIFKRTFLPFTFHFLLPCPIRHLRELHIMENLEIVSFLPIFFKTISKRVLQNNSSFHNIPFGGC